MSVKPHPNPRHVPRLNDLLTIRMSRRVRDEFVKMLDDQMNEMKNQGLTWFGHARKRYEHLGYLIRVLTKDE